MSPYRQRLAAASAAGLSVLIDIAAISIVSYAN